MIDADGIGPAVQSLRILFAEKIAQDPDATPQEQNGVSAVLDLVELAIHNLHRIADALEDLRALPPTLHHPNFVK